MCLYNKLNKLSNKIEHYSTLLSAKTEDINNINSQDKEEKLIDWNKCKNNLSQQLNCIDNKLNRFIKDSNYCILKLNNNNNFGTDRVLNVIDEFQRIVDISDNINTKLYNCFMYGTFFEPNILSLQNDEFNLQINKSKLLVDKFLLTLKNNNSYLAGGYINMAINYPSYSKSHSTDMDIYVNKKNFKKLYEEITNIINITHNYFEIASAYNESFFRKNGLLSRIKLISFDQKLDILIIRDDYNLIDVIKNFDLSYCSVYLDPNDLVIKGNIEDMLNKTGKLNDDYATKYLFNKFIQRRIKKYSNRGYKTQINTHIDIMMQKKEPKIINNASIYHKILQKLSKIYYGIISENELYNILSITEYSK